MGARVLEMREPKLVTVGIRQRGWWDVIGFSRDKWELEIQVVKDLVVDGCEPVKLELRGLSSEPCKESDFVIMKVGMLEDVEVPLTLLSVSRQVVNVAGNGRLM